MVLLFRRKADRTEDIHADGPEGFLTYHSVIVGEAADYKAYEFILSIGSDLFLIPDFQRVLHICDSFR